MIHDMPLFVFLLFEAISFSLNMISTHSSPNLFRSKNTKYSHTHTHVYILYQKTKRQDCRVWHIGITITR